jgi:hypothetical protein
MGWTGHSSLNRFGDSPQWRAASVSVSIRFGVSVIWNVAVLIKVSIGRSACQATSAVVR